MKKYLLALISTLALAQGAAAQKVQINIDMGSSGSLVILPQGMVVEFGRLQMARSRVVMTNGNLGIGSDIITIDSYRGKVIAINPATQALSVEIGRGIYKYNLEQVAVTNGCNGVYCVGELVRTNDLYSGVVAGFFGDGKTVVKIGHGLYNYRPDELGLTSACIANFCTGDAVVTDDNYAGKVDAIFSDGSLAVKIGGSAFKYKVESLSMTQAICANIYIQRVGLCY